jgi:hypothetical protein
MGSRGRSAARAGDSRSTRPRSRMAFHEWRAVAYDDTTARDDGSEDRDDPREQPRAATRASRRSGARAGTCRRGSTSARPRRAGRCASSDSCREAAWSPRSPRPPGRSRCTAGSSARGTSACTSRREFMDGVLARSGFVDLAIADASGAPSGQPPVRVEPPKARARDGERGGRAAGDVRGRARFGSWSVLSPPAQAAIVGGGSGPYRILRPNAARRGRTR